MSVILIASVDSSLTAQCWSVVMSADDQYQIVDR